MANNFNYCPIVWHLCGATNNNKIRENTRRLRIIYKDYESPIERLLEMSNTTSLAISRLRLILLEVYKSINQLHPKCMNGLFEEKSTSYSLRYPVKVLQPRKRTTPYGLRSISYTGAKFWNDLLPILNNDVEFDVFKSSLQLFLQKYLPTTFLFCICFQYVLVATYHQGNNCSQWRL